MKKILQKKIAFISSNIGSTFISTIIRASELRIKEKRLNYKINYFPAGIRENDIDKVILEVINSGEIDGFIIAGIKPVGKSRKLLVDKKIPTVLIEQKLDGLHSITIDNFKSGYEAAKRILLAGRKKIGVIIDPQTKIKDMATYERFRGFKKCMKDNGINLLDKNIEMIELHTIEQGRMIFEKMENKIKNLDAIFSVAGDLVAIGFMLEAKANGIKIPDDIAIVGFDDIEMAIAVEPALTTVRQPIKDMGSIAINIIHKALTGELDKLQNIILRSEFIKRETL